MATEVAAAYVSLVPSARGFSRGIARELSGLDAVGKQVGTNVSNSLHSRITSGFSRTVGELGRLATRGGLLMAGGLGVAGGFAIKTAADFEQTRISFEGILGDVGKATSLLDDLRSFAASTPFEFPGLADSAKNLLAVGFQASEIIPTMTTLGNVAATLGVGEAEISGVVRALGQMRGKGKASAEELQQISEQVPGFSAVKAIAEDMGLTVGETFKKLEAGAVPADRAIEAILNGMELFPGAAGAMDRQSKTLNGVLSTLKDTVSGLAIDFISPYLPAISGAISGFSTGVLQPFLYTLRTGFTEDEGTRVEGFALGIRTAFIAVRDFFRDHLIPTVAGLVSDGLGAIRDWWERNGETVTGFFTTFADIVGEALGRIGSWIWVTVLPALAAFGGWLVDNEEVVVGVLAAIAAAFLAWAINAAIAAASTVIAALPVYLLLAAVALLAAGLYFAWTRSESFRTSVIELGLGLYAAAAGVVAFFRTMWRWADQAFDAVSALFDVVRDLVNVLPDLPGGLGLESFIPSMGPLPWADDGGVMPGPRGVHSLAWVAGGETILPTHKAPLPVLTGGGGETHLHVIQHPGEDQVSAGMRALKWHQTVQMEQAS